MTSIATAGLDAVATRVEQLLDWLARRLDPVGVGSSELRLRSLVAVLVVKIGPMLVGVLAGRVTMGMAVLAGERRLVYVIVMRVVVTMSVLMRHRLVAM